MVILSGFFIAWTMESILEFSIFIGFLYWAFPGFFCEGFVRVNKMVDVVTNRVFDTYNRFSPLNNNQNESLATLSSLKRFARDQKFKKALSREADTQTRDDYLFHVKKNAAKLDPKERPYMGRCCHNCTLVSKESYVTKTTGYLALRNVLNYQLPQHSNGFLQRTFSHLHQVYQLKKFDYPQVTDLVLKDKRLKQAIEKATIDEFQDSEDAGDEFYKLLLNGNQKRAKKLLYDMRSTLSDFLLRFTSWVLYKLLSCFLTSVVVHPGQVEVLKEASKYNLPLIFLPLHRSHLDYILISFILLNNNIRSPLVAAGDNLRIPFFGSLLRGLGAFFIRRRMDPIMGRRDRIYKAVLHTYMNNCLRAGHNMEFFLEGGRTRTGKPCMPKYGILSVILDSFMDGTFEDALLVPISVNYEKLVDGNFIREQLGKPKEMETFGSAIKGIWSVLNSNYGMMRIDFNQPFSLRELVKTFKSDGIVPPNGVKKTLKSNPSTTSLYGTDIVSEELKTLVETISKHIMFDCSRSTCIMSTNALAFLLLTKYREGASIEQLVNALDNLRKELEYAGRDVGFTGDSLDVVNYAVDMLGPALVRKERINNEDIIKPIAILPNVIELTYYSNTLVPHFALDSIVAIAIEALDKSSGHVIYRDLLDNVLDLCDILQYEFFFHKPCQSLEEVITSCIDDLVIRKEIFLVCEVEHTELTERSRRIARQFDDETEEEQYPEKVYKVNQSESAVNTLSYLRGIVMPLVESYCVTAFTLDKLVGTELIESELIKDITDELKLQLGLGTIKYDESISVDPIKNALKVYQKWGSLECHSEGKLRVYYLRDNQDDSESVRALYHRVNKYRQSS